MWADVGDRLGPPIKVKAHLTLGKIKARGQEELWHTNAAANAAAKKRPTMLVPPEAFCQELCRLEAVRKRFIRGIATILARYPRPSALVKQGRGKAVQRMQESLVLIRGHELAWIEHHARWVCLQCLKCCGAGRLGTFGLSQCRESTSAAASMASCRFGPRA